MIQRSFLQHLFFLTILSISSFSYAQDFTPPPPTSPYPADACQDLLDPSHGFSKVAETIEREIRPKWDPQLFTDPKHHNPENFRYIIRVCRNRNDYYSQGIPLDLKKSFQAEVGLEGAMISASLISRNTEKKLNFVHAFNSEDFAYILQIPAKNIVITTFKDTGRMSLSWQNDMSENTFNSYAARYGMFAPDELIVASQAWSTQVYPQDRSPVNEILYRGSPEVKVKGIVHFKNEPTQKRTPNVEKLLLEISSRLEVPIVEL